MKAFLLTLASLLAIAALLNAALIVVKWDQFGDSDYEQGRLTGKIFITVFLGIGSLAAFKRALRKRPPAVEDQPT